MKHNLKQLGNWMLLSDQPIFFMTAGLPGSGKSTFLNGLRGIHPGLVIASTDDFIESEGRKMGLNYSEAFKAISFSHAKSACDLMIKTAVKDKQNLVLDQTNCGSKARRTKLKNIPQNYLKVCLVFDVPEKELWARLEARSQETGKTIPGFVVKNMMSSWQTPSKDDGFDHIIDIIQ